MLRGLVTLALAAALTGCSWPSSAQNIGEVYASDDGTKLQVVVNACSEKTAVEVSESTDQVGLTATAPRTDTDCQTAVVVTLKAPLAQRPVVDLHTGKVLDVIVEQPGADWTLE